MSREAFEAWFVASKYAQVVIPTEGDIQRAWDAWQASRKAALLEAAEAIVDPNIYYLEEARDIVRRMAEE